MKKAINEHRATLLERLICLFRGHHDGDLYFFYEHIVVEPGCIRCGKRKTDYK